MNVEQAQDLAARTLAAIDTAGPNLWDDDAMAADRARVASDLAGLTEHSDENGHCRICGIRYEDCPDATRYADGLIRTAALYGVTP